MGGFRESGSPKKYSSTIQHFSFCKNSKSTVILIQYNHDALITTQAPGANPLKEGMSHAPDQIKAA